MIETDAYRFMELCELGSYNNSDLVRKGLTRQKIQQELNVLAENVVNGKLLPTATKMFRKQLLRKNNTINKERAGMLFKTINDYNHNYDPYVLFLQQVNLFLGQKRFSLSELNEETVLKGFPVGSLMDLLRQNNKYFAGFPLSETIHLHSGRFVSEPSVLGFLEGLPVQTEKEPGMYKKLFDNAVTFSDFISDIPSVTNNNERWSAN